MNITRAMIMGAGLGSRMRPLTNDRPKPLVTVAGKTLIDHTLDRLATAGVREVVVNVHYRATQLIAHLSQRHDVAIIISDETDELLDTGGGVVKALPHFRDEPFFILNSDSLWIERGAPVLPAMAAAWHDDMDSLLLLAEMQTAIGYDGAGDFVLLDQNHVARARDRSEKAYGYLGAQIAHPRLFADAPAGPFSTNIMWDRAIARGRLAGVVLDGVWLHVGTPEARDQAERALAAPATA